MKRTIINLSLMLAGFYAGAQNAVLQWGKQFGGPGLEKGTPIAVDKNGNLHAAVVFDGTTDFDPGPGTVIRTAAGGFDFAVTKLNSAGNHVWTSHISGLLDEFSNFITLDTLGNVYVIGYFTDTVDFDPGPGTYTLYAADEDVFVLKLTSTGTLAWARQFEGAGYDTGDGIAVDNAGNVYTTGSYDGTVDFDPGPGTVNLSATAFGDGFVSKLDVNGNFVFVKALESQDLVSPTDLTVDQLGDVYLTGVFYASTDFDPSGSVNALNTSSVSAFVLKLNSSGNFQYVKEIGGNPTEIKLDGNGNVFVVGSFDGAVDFDPGPGVTVLTAAQTDYFALKLTNSGNFSWAKQSGTSDNAIGYSIALDAGGNVFLTGTFDNFIDLDPGPGTFSLTSLGGEDVFLSKLDNNGNFTWGGTIGGSDLDLLVNIAVDNSGNIYGGGLHFSNDIDIDPGTSTYTLTTANPFFDVQAFVLKFNICDMVVDTNNTTALCSGGAAIFSVSSTGNISWYTSATSTSSVAGGNSYTTAALSAGSYTYFAESSTCGASRLPMTVTVHALPQVSVTTSQQTICATMSASVTLAGANAYSVNGSPSASSFTISPANTTTYIITGISAEGCENSSNFVQYVDLCLGVDNGDVASFNIYPNPARKEFSVNTNSATRISIYTMEGRMVAESKVSSGTTTFSNLSLAPGLYMVTLEREGRTASRKLVIE